MSAGDTKECPFCAETIRAAARGCRFCGTVLAPEGATEAGFQALPAVGVPLSPGTIAEAEVADLLAGLVEKSLVLYEEDKLGQGRYRLLETVRQYGRDRLLESQEGVNLRSRHGQFFLRLAEEAEPELRSPEPREPLTRLNTEYDNCRAALEWSLWSDEGAEAGLRMATALTTFWARWGYDREARDWLDRVLNAGSGEFSAARVKALISAGRMAVIQGNGPSARLFLEAGLAGAEATGDRGDLLGAHAQLGQTLLWQGEIEKARFHAEKCLILSQEIGTSWASHVALYGIGLIRLYEHDYAAAADYFARCLPAAREAADGWNVGFTFLFLSRTAYYRGDLPAARARLNEAQSVFEDLGVRIGLAWVMLCRGMDADDQGEHRAAAALYEESLGLFRELGAVRGQASALHDLGRLARLAHDFDTARASLRESLELFRAAGTRSGICRALSGLASLALAEGEPGRAARLFGAAAALPDGSELPLFHAARADYDRCLAETRAALGEPVFAAAWAEGQALPMEQAIEYALGASREGHS